MNFKKIDDREKWWETIDTLKHCRFCGQPVRHGNGWSTVGMCAAHAKIWEEDIEGGFKQNRLRQIMIDRDEITVTLQAETKLPVLQGVTGTSFFI